MPLLFDLTVLISTADFGPWKNSPWVIDNNNKLICAPGRTPEKFELHPAGPENQYAILSISTKKYLNINPDPNDPSIEATGTDAGSSLLLFAEPKDPSNNSPFSWLIQATGHYLTVARDRSIKANGQAADPAGWFTIQSNLDVLSV